MDHLPLVLLGIRTSVRPDTGLCPAELVFGSSLRLPGDFIAAPELPPCPLSTDFAASLRQVLAAQRLPAADHHRPPGPVPSLPPCLAPSTVTHAFVRVDAVRKPLTRPYDGPFKILAKSPKTFTLLRADKPWTVSVDRLKPAPVFGDCSPPPFPIASPVSSSSAPSPPSLSSSSSSATGANATVLRSGRVSRPLCRF